MRHHSWIAGHNQTRYIYLDTSKCRACWKCIESCPEGVIGKIDLPFHKHVRISQPDQCKGCLKCVNVCPEEAIISLNPRQASEANL